MLEFTLSGFLFAIINFLILVALLYKFLHKPLLAVLEKRKTAIETAQNAAREQSEKATALTQEYQQKLDGIEEERDKLLSDAKRRADAARDELLEKARGEAEREVANLKHDWERQERDAVEALQERVVQTAIGLAGKILTQLADSDVETCLRKQLFAELDGLAAASEKEGLGLFAEDAPVRVVSAGPLDDDARGELEKRVAALPNGAKVKLEFSDDAALVAGTRIEFVSIAVNANLADVVQTVLESMGRAQERRTTE